MECECQPCKNACSHMPGWFKPEQINKVAEFLEISIQKLFDTKLAVNWWENPNMFSIVPATINMKPGREVNYNPRGICIFFKEGKCEIHSVKPFECFEFSHKSSRKDVDNAHEEAAFSWKNDQEMIIELLGEEPIMADNDGSFSIGFGF